MRYRPAARWLWRPRPTAASLRDDVVAGITVGMVALPLAMAFGIASLPVDVADDLASRAPWLTPPAIGIYTAIVAGFLISAFGGSRVQIGGPTGAFIPIVYAIAAEHGYDGLVAATVLAGGLLIVMGACRFGAVVKFIPYPVVVGFTAGIAVIIAASQLPGLLGLRLVDDAGRAVALPPDFLGKLRVVAANLPRTEPLAVAVGAGVVAVVLLLRRLLPRFPGPIAAVAAATAAAAVLDLPLETIGDRFGSLPRTLPTPALPALPVDVEALRALLPAAVTIALLGAIESLLSAVVADGMTGQRHDPDAELIGQGVGNLGAALFWGIPATGAIARTATNVRAGGRSPLSGMVHALALAGFLLAAAPLAERVPLCALAGLLLVVAWNMAKVRHFATLLRAPRSDVAVLLGSFGLTVLVDLTYGVGLGVVAASLLFMKRMAEVGSIELEEAGNGAAPPELPHGVAAYQVQGPFFFGVAERLLDTLQTIAEPHRVFILRMRHVPTIDATGIHALDLFAQRCHARGTRLLLTGVQPAVRTALARAGLGERLGEAAMVADLAAALALLAGDGRPG